MSDSEVTQLGIKCLVICNKVLENDYPCNSGTTDHPWYCREISLLPAVLWLQHSCCFPICNVYS